MIHKTFQFDFSDLKLTIDQIERVLGYPEGESHETFAGIVAKLLREAETICNLKAEYRIYENIVFHDDNKSIEVNNMIFSIGKIIYGQIKKSDSVALFACTAGDEIGKRSRSAMKEVNLLEGYIYDVIGSEAVEAVADLMQDDLEADLSLSGRKITNRFSPGYCGWNVSEQHKLFGLIPENYCIIRLTESALMDPIKSISGIIGVGENVRRLPYTCKLCDMKGCIYRRNV
jgi:hypothetical protein